MTTYWSVYPKGIKAKKISFFLKINSVRSNFGAASRFLLRHRVSEPDFVVHESEHHGQAHSNQQRRVDRRRDLGHFQLFHDSAHLLDCFSNVFHAKFEEKSDWRSCAFEYQVKNLAANRKFCQKKKILPKKEIGRKNKTWPKIENLAKKI